MVSFGDKKSEKQEVRSSRENYYFLTLHNDDFNTFDYVIETLCEVCEHDESQAEQCALITHYRGKCDIKKGGFQELAVLKDKLISRELSVTID